MRTLACLIALATITACTTTGRDAEIAAATRANAESATADAANISKETDPVGRSAQCYVFIGVSRHHNSRAVGYDDAAMEQAQNQHYAFLVQRLEKIGADQLTGSSVNMLAPAAAAQRDAASRWCVQNAPEVDPED
jgi:hypothetical protein